VSSLADKFKVSRPTIYKVLEKVRKNHKNNNSFYLSSDDEENIGFEEPYDLENNPERLNALFRV
jgi:hypothetical protein